MSEDKSKFRCGNCGNDQFKLFDNDKEQCITSMCTNCGLKSFIKLHSELYIGYDHGDPRGRMCVF